jgi:adenosine kinase
MEIVVTGSIAYDYLMRFPGKFKEHLLAESLHKISLSLLVDEMSRHWGGVGANIAYNHALLGGRPRLFGTVGKDFNDYRVWLEASGVDTTACIAIDHVYTASFFANTDQENNQIASFYGGAMSFARNFTLSETFAQRPDYVVISPNDPLAMQQFVDECHGMSVPFMYDPSQQLPRLDGELLRYQIERCHTLIVNEYEWNMLSTKTGLDKADVLRHAQVLIITLGKQGAEIYADDNKYFVPVFPVPDEYIADPTGVGDAFRAGILRGMELGWSWDVAGLAASLCSAYALQQVGTQTHRFTIAEFIERFRTQFDDRGELDSLLTNTPVSRPKVPSAS